MPIILLTGLPGAGKSTLAQALCMYLQEKNYPTALIDGDQYRNTINQDLGFSEADRRENIRRLMQVAEEKNKAGYVAVVAAINPFEDQRQHFVIASGALVIYIKCAIEVLVKRDTKGLYKLAMLPNGHPDKIYNLTGVNDPYDIPQLPDLVVETSKQSVEMAAEKLFNFILIKLKPA